MGVRLDDDEWKGDYVVVEQMDVRLNNSEAKLMNGMNASDM